MFAIKDWEVGFLWVEFREHPFVDIQENKEVKKYDVSTKHYPDYPSNFMRDGVFDQRQYCICLLRVIPDLSKDGLVEFLKHQCKLMKDPVEWLLKFEELLEIAEDYEPVKAFKIRLKLLRNFIEEEFVLISTAGPEGITYPSIDLVEEPEEMYYIDEDRHYLDRVMEEMEKTDDYRTHISICKKARATYLRKVENASESSDFIRAVDKFLDPREELVSKTPKKEVWKGTAIALAEYHIRNNVPRDNKGRFIVPPSHAIEARRIGDLYTDDKGNPFKFETLQTEIGKVVREVKSMYDSEDEK